MPGYGKPKFTTSVYKVEQKQKSFCSFYTCFPVYMPEKVTEARPMNRAAASSIAFKRKATIS